MKNKKTRENLILVDFGVNEEFDLDKKLEEYSSEKWIVKNFANNYFPRLIRQITYFLFPILFIPKIHRYKKIIAWQQFFGIILAFYCRLLHVKRKRFITIMTFIYKPRTGIKGKLYYYFVKYAVESQYVKSVVCYSRNEITHYSKLFNQKFVFCPLGIRDCYNEYETDNNKPNLGQEGYFLSCGRSNRDYEFLLDAFKTQPYNLKIICDELEVKSHDNIKIYNDIKDEAYYEMLSKCYAVIIPLKDKIISSGQMVLIEAMMFGKPIIVTKTSGLKDYISEEVLVIENTDDDLAKAIDSVMDDDLHQNISNKIRDYYMHAFTQNKMFCKICKIVYS